jgi:hypothetical protein
LTIAKTPPHYFWSCSMPNIGHASAVHQSRQLGCTVESFTSVDLLAYWRANGIAADRCWYSCAELDDDWQVRGQGGIPWPALATGW